MKRFWIRKVIGIVCMVIIGIMVFSGIVMLLWNALLPQLFHFPTITWPQALGLLVLCKILFGGFRGGPRKHEFKEKMRQKFMNMTPEERDQFKQDWRARCRPFERGNFEGGRTQSPPSSTPTT